MKISRKKLSLVMIRAGVNSSKQLANLAGVSENTISRINNGASAKLSTVQRLSCALGVSPEEIISEVQ